jgi:hypothetical protein
MPDLGQAAQVTFNVEVPYCTPINSEIMLRSNRMEATSFIHDKMTQLDRTHYSGTFEVVTGTDDFEYKYCHGICNDFSCPGIEKDISYNGSLGDIEPRKLEPYVTTVSDLVFIWRDAVRNFDQNGQPMDVRPIDQQIAFCGPYLSIFDETGSVSISYDSYYGDDIVLDYGLTSDYGYRLTSSTSYRNHFRLESLTAGQTYHFRITENNIPGPDSTFIAPPQAGEPFRFGFMGDTQYYTEEDAQETRQLVELLIDFNPQLLVSSGDLVASLYGDSGFLDPEMGRWNIFFRDLAPLLRQVPFLSAMGNHEEDCDYFWDAFDFPTPDIPNIDHYWFRFGNVHFTVLYTGVTAGYDLEGILDNQSEWLENTLAAAEQDPQTKWKIVILHRGPLSQGANHPDDGNSFYNNSTPNRPSWKELWETYGVDLVLAGHNHNFTWARNNDIHFITSCAGAPVHGLVEPWYETTIYAESTCSADMLEVGQSTISFQAVRPDGSIIEQSKFSLCQQDSDCQELANPCPSEVVWSCSQKACQPSCLQEEDGGFEPNEEANLQEDGGNESTDEDYLQPPSCSCGNNQSPNLFVWFWLLAMIFWRFSYH